MSEKTNSPISEKLKNLQKEKTNSKLWNITWNQGIILSEIVKTINPKNILEIGTSNGFSTLFIYKSLNSNATLYTIEVNKERLELAKRNFNFLNIKNIIQINSEIFKIIEENKLNIKFDLIFVDAVQKDYLKLIKLLLDKKLLSNNHTLIFDNILTHNKENKLFLDFITKKYNFEIIELDSGFLICKSK